MTTKRQKKVSRRKKVSKNDEKLMCRMWEQGYLMSAIGRMFNVKGGTAGRHIRAYQRKKLGGKP
jgi:hypothetical protein